MWKDIEEINWAERSQEQRGYENGKRYVLENFTQARCNKISEFISARFDQLYGRVEQYEQANNCHCGNYSGDDSFGDMIHHAIGLGEGYFNSVMENPKLLDELDYTESFSYCLPYESDFEMLKDGYFQKKAGDCLVELARILKENNPSNGDVEIIVEIMARFGAMVLGDFTTALKGFTPKLYSRYYQFESNDQGALFSNILGDCQKFIL